MEDVRAPLPAQPTKFLDQFRLFIRNDGKSFATEKVYVYWVKQFILFHDKSHPKNMSNHEITAYLTNLANSRDASPNTQKLALNSLMFLYNRFLKQPIDQLDFKYARKQARTPTVFTHEEAMSVISGMVMPYKLMAQLMYGSGLRISEVLRLRVKDVDFAMGYINVRDGKGAKDRTTLLPKTLIIDLRQQVEIVEKLLALDKARGISGVYMPNMLAKKYPAAGHSLAWQFLFPSVDTSKDPRGKEIRRHHLYPTTI